MSHLIRTLVAACGLALLLFTGPLAQAAPRVPVIFSVSESQDTASGDVSLVLLGSRLSVFKTFELRDDGGTDAGTVTRKLRSRTTLVLGLPAGLDSGEYDLVFTYGPRRNPKSLTHRITLQRGGVLPGTLGVASLSAALETDLRDAETLGGELPAHFLDGQSMTPGTLGVEALSPALLTELDDAETLDGQLPSHYLDSKWTESSGDVHRATGRVGIGDMSPAGDLHVAGTDGVLFTGTFDQGTIPAEGAGTRMMWHPAKAALRVGDVDGSQWDDVNVGNFSVAMGRNTTASGLNSTAMGYFATASGNMSTATAYGVASGDISMAIGESTASGILAVSMGYGTTASGFWSTAMGAKTTAQPQSSLVIGQHNTIAGSTNSWVATDPLFVAGNGANSSNRSNALTLLKNGNMTIAGTLTENSDARLKRDIEPLDGVLSKLDGISGVTYRFKDDTTHPTGVQVGLLAQQVQEAFPELVTEGHDGTLSVAYGKFTAVLLEAVREQQAEHEAQIEARDAEVAELREELAKVRKDQNDRLARLEALLTAGDEKAK